MDNNFTNLRNTYLYGKANRKNNYFQNYKNSENNIDDPIFTGFTFAIDTIHSPLFYGNYEINDGLAGRIETNLKSVWNEINSNDSYDIQSFVIRDTFDNGKTIGYGLQENTFAEELLYGAADYIYMVDKNVSGGLNSRSDLLNANIEDFIVPNDNTTSTGINSETPSLQTPGVQGNQGVQGVQGNQGNQGNQGEPQKTEQELLIEQKQKELEDAQKELETLGKDPTQELKNNILATCIEYENKIEELYKKYNDKKNKAQNYSDRLRNIQVLTVDSLLNKDGANITLSIFPEFSRLIDDLNKDDKKENIDISPKSISEVKNDKKTKKELASLWLGGEKYYKKIKDESQVLLLSAHMDVEKICEQDKRNYQNILDEYELFDIRDIPDFEDMDPDLYYQLKNVIGFESPSLEDLSEYIQSNPTKYDQQQQTVDRLIQELRDLKGETDTPQETEEETPQETVSGTPTQQEQSNGTPTNEYGTGSSDVPTTVSNLVEFTSGIKELCEKYPYVFLSVSGLDNAYKKYYKVQDSYYGSGDDTISIECLESLDMKVSSTFNKYLNAIYDRQYRRERVPINLRRFNCSIFVHDIRNFREALSRMSSKFGIDLNGDNVQSYIVELALNYLSVVEFKFFECEIVPDETGSIFDSVSNESESDGLRTNFTFKYGNCVINFLPFGDLYANYSGSGISSNTNIQGTIENTFKSTHTDEFDKNLKDLTIDRDTVNKEMTTDLGKIDMSSNHFEHYEGVNYRRYWDRSVLGNVNNDDYNDYIKRDHTTAADDFIRNQYSNMFVNNSVGEIQNASTELDNALHRTILGISASVGAPPMTVADIMGVGYLNNVWNKPHIDIQKDLGNVGSSNINSGNTSSDINYTSPDSTGTTKQIGNIDVNSKMLGKTNDLDQLNPGTIMLNETDEIGDVIDDISNKGKTNEIGDVIDDINPSYITSDLNDVDVNSKLTGFADNIGDVNMSSNMLYTVNNLDKVNMSGNMLDMTNGIGNVDMSGESSDYTNEIGNIDVSGKQIGNTNEIGDVIDNITSSETTDNIGNVDMSGEMKNTTTEIGDVDVKGNSKNKSQNIGNIDVKSTITNITSDLGLYDLSSKTTGITDNIGKYDLSVKSNGKYKDLGKYDMSSPKSNKLTQDLGKQELPTNEIGSITTNLGNYDNTNNTIIKNKFENLGKFDLERKPIDETKDLGQYDLSSNSKNITTNLGKFDLEIKPIDETKELGKFDLSSKSTDTTTDLGKFDLEGKPIDETKNLGQYDLSSKSTSVTTNIGQNDLSVESNGKHMNLGKYDTSSNSTNMTKDLGKLNLSVESNENYKNLGKFDFKKSPTSITTNIGQYDMNNEIVETTKEIDNVNIDSNYIGKTSNLGKFDLERNPIDETKELGKYDSETQSEATTSNLGQYDLSQKQDGETRELGEVNQDTNEGEKTKNIGTMNKSSQNINDKKPKIFSNLGNVFRN